MGAPCARFAPVFAKLVTPHSFASVRSGVMPWTCAAAGAAAVAAITPTNAKTEQKLPVMKALSSTLSTTTTPEGQRFVSSAHRVNAPPATAPSTQVTQRLPALLRQIESCASRRCPRLRSPWFPNERVRRGLAEQEVTATLELPPEAHNGDKPAERAN